MKIRIALFLLLVMILASCAPAATATEESAGQPPQATELPVTEPPATESPVSVPVTAPLLKVGDVYLYSDGTTLMAVPAGEFTMGGEGSDTPAHLVNLGDYWMYSSRVTNQQYAVCIDAGDCTPPDEAENPEYGNIQHANDPVTGVTYDQAATYCAFVGARLPTEAEWEKAAGNAPDLLGEVFEWIFDWYDPNYYQTSPEDDPMGPETGTARVVRSGSETVTNRNSEDPQAHRSDLGFRCVVDKPEQFAPVCELPPVYGGEAASSCPTLEVSLVKNCAKNFPYTNVIVSGVENPTIHAAECDTSSDPAMVTCQPPFHRFSAEAACEVAVSGEPGCPVGYSLQGNACVANGAPGICPAGMNSDTARQCCEIPSATETSVPAGVCPVGTYYSASQNACLSKPVQELVTVSLDVTYKSCSARPNNDPGSCKEPAGGCLSSDWLPGSCCCSYDGSSCGYYP